MTAGVAHREFVARHGQARCPDRLVFDFGSVQGRCVSESHALRVAHEAVNCE